jgi:RimJ/RimL family protein N-acetyltransferase
MELVRFDAKEDPDRLRAAYEMVVAGWPDDDPNVPVFSLEAFAGNWIGWDGEPRECWLAYADDGLPVGCCVIGLPERANRSMALGAPYIAPDRRRTGLGSELLEHCIDRARQAGRTRLSSHIRDGSPGAAFAAAKGARGGIDAVFRAMDIDAHVPDRVAALRRDALPHAADYEFLSWEGATPEEHIDGVVRVHAAMADAPRDEGVEPWTMDAEQIRQVDQTIADQGLGIYTVVARNSGSGEFAALTQIAVDPTLPEWALQQVTAVAPAHRGHRLGLLVKIEMLDLLARKRPTTRRILTGNAGLNAHMIAINEQLGYYISDVYRSWELDIGQS